MIELAKYQNAEQSSISVVFDGKQYSVPAQEGNRYYQRLLEWVHQPSEQWYADWEAYMASVDAWNEWWIKSDDPDYNEPEPTKLPKPPELTELPVVNPIAPYEKPTIVKTRFSSNEYFDRFTEAEQDDIIDETYIDKQVKKFYDRMWGSDFIDLEDPRTEQGIDLLIYKGLIQAERKAPLLLPEIQ